LNRFVRISILAGTVFGVSCVTMVQSGSVRQFDPQMAADSVRGEVQSPMKAFMLDGAIVVFEGGARVTTDSMSGPGVRYSMGFRDTVEVTSVPLDSMVGVEAFDGKVHGLATFLVSVTATALAVGGGAVLAVAIFGSCPTFYALPEAGGTLQAEAFSYSVSPLAEARDLDVTGLVPGTDGVIRLELRNEALETHYINHLELIAVEHAPGVRVLVDDRESPLGVVGEIPPTRAVDRIGRDVRDALETADGVSFASAERRVRDASSSDPGDHVDLTFPRPDTDSAVVVLRLRNSLLTTVLFYDLMLGRAGVRAVDWIGQDLTRIGPMVELGQWVQQRMGLKVDVFDGREWVSAGRISDTGPIAWEDVGVRVRVPSTDSLRVRLGFLTDAWRIDQVSLGGASPLSPSMRVPVARLEAGGEIGGPEVLAQIAHPDDEYLTTYPGNSARLDFEPPPPTPGFAQSYLLSTQGYYTEWVRTEWMRRSGAGPVFQPDEHTIETLMEMWLDRKEEFEAEFHDSRIPVR
jgi:hypothetical protein